MQKRVGLLFLVLFGISIDCVSYATAQETHLFIYTGLARPVVLDNHEEINYLRISLTAPYLKPEQHSPINLALFINRADLRTGGDKYKFAKIINRLTIMLGDQDTLSIILYDDSADATILHPTVVSDKRKLSTIIWSKILRAERQTLFTSQSTGLQMIGAFLESNQANHIIFLTEAPITMHESFLSELSALMKQANRKGVAVSTIRMGAQYDEKLFGVVITSGEGRHVLVKDEAEIERALLTEFSHVRSAVARDTIVEIQTAEHIVPVRVLGQKGDIVGRKVTFRLNRLYEGQEKMMLLEVRTPLELRHNSKLGLLAEVNVSYVNQLSGQKHYWNKVEIVRYGHTEMDVLRAQVNDILDDVVDLLPENSARLN